MANEEARTDAGKRSNTSRPTASSRTTARIEFIFSSGTGLLVGWNGEQAKFKAVGTAALPIVFRGAEDTVGYWNGITIGTSATADSSLDYVQLKNAGLALRRSVSVTNSSFTKSGGFGILKPANDMTDYMATNTFADNKSGPVGM